MLTVEGVSAGYTETPCLRDISFSLQQGESAVILGPNGSGKSTLLRILAKVLEPLSGSISLRDLSITSFSQQEWTSRVAYVPQDFIPAFPYRVRELLEMSLALRTPRKAKSLNSDLVEEAIAATDIADLVDREITHLSAGERQRALLATGLVTEPEVLLLDEPTSALDPYHRTQILDVIAQISSRGGRSVVMVTHDLTAAYHSFSKALFLKDGFLTRSGSTELMMEGGALEELYGVSFTRIHDQDGKGYLYSKMKRGDHR